MGSSRCREQGPRAERCCTAIYPRTNESAGRLEHGASFTSIEYLERLGRTKVAHDPDSVLISRFLGRSLGEGELGALHTEHITLAVCNASPL